MIINIFWYFLLMFSKSLSVLCSSPTPSLQKHDFTKHAKAQLPFILLRNIYLETFFTIRQNSLYVTVCMIARTFYQGYFIHSLSTLHYCNAPSLATRLTGDYRDRTYTGKCGPASLDTPHKKDLIERISPFYEVYHSLI